MPDNDKIQLPKGFKLDQPVETPNVKLPKGFTLDTEVVKKKVGGAESSLTELSSKGFSPEQISLLQTGVEAPKPSGKRGQVVVPTNLGADQKAYERELRRQDAAINTLKNTYSQKGLKFDEKSKRGQEQILGLLDKEKENDLALVTGKDQKPYLVRGEGFLASAGKGLLRSIIDPIESTSINTTNDPDALADLLDEKIAEEPNVPTSAPTKFGGYLGELAGGLPKLMALLSIPYVGESAMVSEMYHNGLANQRRLLYEKGLQEGMDRRTAAANAMKNAPITAIPDAVVGAALARGPGGKAAGREIIPNAAKESFLSATNKGIKGVAKVSAIGGTAEFGRSKAQQALGYDVSNAEAIENGLRGMGDYALMDAAFKLAHAGPKYLSSAAKNLLSTVPKEVLEVAAEKYPDGQRTLDEVAKFTETKATVQDFVPEEKVAAVTGLTEKVQNLEKNIKELEEKKKTSSQALHPFMDGWIKEYQDEIDFYKKQVDKVVKSKDPTGVAEEIDDITGLKAGEKPIIQEEAVVTEEVKPTEEKDYNTLYHNSTAENLKLEDIDLLRKGQSQLKKSMKNLPEELQPSGFYTTDDVMSRFMGGTNKYSFKFPKNAKVKDLAAEGRVTDRLSKKELVDLRNQGYDIIKGKNMAGQQEFIPLNKELIKDWKYEGPNIKKENEKYYYTKVTPEGPVQIEVPENIYKSIEKNRYEQVKEEVKPTEVKPVFVESKFEKPITQESLESISQKNISDLAKKINNKKTALNIDVFSGTELGTDNKITNNQNIYLLHSEGKEIGVLTVNNEKLGNREESSIGGVVLHPDIKGKGIGKEMYIYVNNDLIKRGKQPLKSDYDITEDAINVWRSLIKSGEAKEIGTFENGKPAFEMNKPTEVDLTTAEKMNASQNRYGIVKDGAEAGFIVTTNPENNVVKIKGVTVNEGLRGKNIAGDAYVKLGESLAKDGVSLESDSFDKMEASATRVWEKLVDKGLAVKGENSYQFKPAELKETIKTTENAIQEPSAGRVLQPEQEGVREAGGERKRVEQGVKGKEIAKEGKQVEGDEKVITKKTYQEAVKEKLEADKKRNREAGAARGAITKEVFRRVDKMEAPADAEQIALRYLADGGKVSKGAVDEAYGSVKRAQLNVKRRELLSEEVKSKDFVGGEETLDEVAHKLWERSGQKIPESEIKNALMAEIGSNNTRAEAAEAYLDRYSPEYKLEKEEMRLAEQYEQEYLEEQAKLEEELRRPLDEQVEGEASEEHINNLINQYEAEIKGQDQQLRSEGKGEAIAEARKGEAVEKAPKGEEKLAQEYKEVIKKAGKKAKENAKKDFVDRNFDSIVAKLKIQIKCPT